MTAPTPLPHACQAAEIDGEPALSLHRERCTTCGPSPAPAVQDATEVSDAS